MRKKSKAKENDTEFKYIYRQGICAAAFIILK